MRSVLVASGVTVQRDGATLLDQVDVHVRAGERWALLGGNGAGKSTLLGLLGARRFPTSGTVEVLGHRLGRVAVHDLWPLIGQVSSGYAPSGRLTARQVALTGAVGTAALPLRWEPSPALRARVAALCSTLGTDAVLDHPWTTLSAGERGRVLVARALVNDPPLLLLDEPATGLDLPARERLVDALDALSRDEPERASVLVTHHVEELPSSTTHALLLRGGRVLAAGPADEVLTAEPLSACFDLPLAVARHDGRWSARGARPARTGAARGQDRVHPRGERAQMTPPDQDRPEQAPPEQDRPEQAPPVTPASPAPYDARKGDGDPRHDPAAIGERSVDEPDADGGATPGGSDASGPA